MLQVLHLMPRPASTLSRGRLSHYSDNNDRNEDNFVRNCGEEKAKGKINDHLFTRVQSPFSFMTIMNRSRS